MSERRYIAALTGMRGVAAFMVFMYHYAALNPGIRLDLAWPIVGVVPQFLLGFGSYGVDVFFVLSGFLLTLPFANHALGGGRKPALGRYIKRRILRVFPAYYTQLLVITLAGAWFLTWRELDLREWLAHAVMYFNVGADPVRPMVGVWWTLPVELGFYMLLPLLALALPPRRWAWLFPLLLILSMFYRGWAAAHFADAPPQSLFLAASHLPGNLPEFLMGANAALLAQWLDGNRHIAWVNSEKVLTTAVILGLLIPALWLWNVVLAAGEAYWHGHWAMIVGPSVIGLPLSLAVLAIYRGAKLGRWLFANPVVYFFGLISYSLYLWHFPVMQQVQWLAGEAWQSWGHGFRFASLAVIVTAVAAVSYALSERPFFKLGTQSK